MDTAAINTNPVGFLLAVLTAALTVLTFILAFATVPILEVFYTTGCAKYTYLDTAGQYPWDFRWMPLAILMVLAYVALWRPFTHRLLQRLRSSARRAWCSNQGCK